MQVIVEYNDEVVNNITLSLGYVPVIFTFSEMFDKYKKTLKKSKRNFATEEIFSLDYDTPLYDLKRSIWINVDKEDLQKLKDNKDINILEVCY